MARPKVYGTVNGSLQRIPTELALEIGVPGSKSQTLDARSHGVYDDGRARRQFTTDSIEIDGQIHCCFLINSGDVSFRWDTGGFAVRFELASSR